MSTTLTVRTDEGMNRALRKKAAEQGKTVSQFVRDLLAEALVVRSVAARAGSLKGQLSTPAEPDDAWRRQLRERNWRS